MIKSIIRLCSASCLLASLALGGMNAYASHYDIQDVQLVSADIQAQMIAEGISNTEQLFAELILPEQRKAFESRYGLSAVEVDRLAHLLELMQIPGIGPKAATLLMASGIKDVDALAKSAPDQLLEKVLATNAQYMITGIQPDIVIIQDWISKAGQVFNKLHY